VHNAIAVDPKRGIGILNDEFLPRDYGLEPFAVDSLGRRLEQAPSSAQSPQ
jgi:hypothetical protein